MAMITSNETDGPNRPMSMYRAAELAQRKTRHNAESKATTRMSIRLLSIEFSRRIENHQLRPIRVVLSVICVFVFSFLFFFFFSGSVLAREYHSSYGVGIARGHRPSPLLWQGM
jgi:hypothetical protein